MELKGYLALAFAILSPILAIAKERNTFTDGIFEYTVCEDVIIATGDSTVSITNIDRAKITTPLITGDTLVIPKTVAHNGYTYQITEIADTAFARCDNLEHLSIQEGVEYIGEYAFSHCPRLESIDIPSTIYHIGSGAFKACPNLKRIRIDKRNRHYDARNGCNAIIDSPSATIILGCSNTVIPHNVKHIGSSAFSDCTGLDSIQIPEGVTRIGANAFSGCVALRHISLPQSLLEIETGAFLNCNNLRRIYIPQNVLQIEEGSLFGGCLSLDSIIVDSRNKQYDSRNGCNAIVETATAKLIAGCQNTNIIEGIKEIGTSAFGNATLQRISIPASVTKIHAGAFWGCDFCTSITVDNNNLTYDSRNHSNAIIETATNKLIVGCITTHIPSDIIEIGERAFQSMPMPQSFTIPEGIKRIGKAAFRGCKGLQRVSIPKSIQEIEESAFSMCPSLSEVYWESNVKEIKRCTFFACPNLRLISIPAGTKAIAEFAFWDCGHLHYVSLPSSLEYINKTAFKGCPCDSLVQQNHQAIISTKRL